MNTKTKHYWLYVLQLEGGKYYIGLSSRSDAKARILEHFHGFYTAQWVRKHAPIDVYDIIHIGEMTFDEAQIMENRLTKQYMQKYGRNNVRGGVLNYSGKYVYIPILGYFYRGQDAVIIATLLLQLFVIAYLVIN
ncbi:hypothetical protein KDA06_02640 [Candidatus Saccharibacteria bacterium]|jgi:predicted GIY-YIG superfamily endonuclease|nr:hypothetical protein [Candidatus Saccharibacteria bacterium]HPR09930.1 hypothetical protein [Candidatus Saccharibacteria bacterium]